MLAQSLAFQHRWQDIVNQTKTCDNQFVSVHRVPPQFFARRSESLFEKG
jgi:hypothetical protein